MKDGLTRLYEFESGFDVGEWSEQDFSWKVKGELKVLDALPSKKTSIWTVKQTITGVEQTFSVNNYQRVFRWISYDIPDSVSLCKSRIALEEDIRAWWLFATSLGIKKLLIYFT